MKENWMKKESFSVVRIAGLEPARRSDIGT